MKRSILLLAFVALLTSCGNGPQTSGPELFEASAFEKTVDGKAVTLFTLRNENGMAVQLTNYGARMVDLWVPAADGSYKDVIHGFSNIDSYLNATDVNNGPVVGCYGNRIGTGRFTLDGKEFQLTLNEGNNHLHGGVSGFGFKVWDAEQTTDAEGNRAVRMTYVSPDGEEGYPGNLIISVLYSLTQDNKLVISYDARTDAPTVLNPTSHSYFNLHGTTAQSTNSHVLTLHAGHFTPTDRELIPTGEIVPVDGTPLDFRSATPIGERIDSDYEPIVFGGGYDHNWILDKNEGELSLAAEVYEPSTGIVMKVYTDQPAIQFYSGNFMDGTEEGKRGDRNNYRSGIALETQNYPDAPNHENFPSSVLKPGEVYTHTCIYEFDTRD